MNMLLWIEVLLLAQMVYLFWSARRLHREHQDAAQRHSPGVIGMEQALGEVLDELQQTMISIEGDWTRRTARLESMLHEAAMLLAEVESRKGEVARPPVLPPNTALAGETECTAFHSVVTGMVEQFSQSLLAEGRSDSSVTRACGYVREFLAYRDGEAWETRAGLAPITQAQQAAFERHLKEQGLQPATITRKLRAVERFRAWATAQDTRAGEEKATHVEAGMPATNGRYREALSLAREGWDVPTIAARTELEQDAIWMLLSSEPGRFSPARVAVAAD